MRTNDDNEHGLSKSYTKRRKKKAVLGRSSLFCHEHPLCKRLITSRKSTLIHEVSRQLAVFSLQRAKTDSNQWRYRSESEAGLKARYLNLNGVCEYCETRKAVTLDHFYPIVRDRKPTVYGSDVWNCVPCCKECNSSKGGKTCAQWFASDTSRYNPCGTMSSHSTRKKVNLRKKFKRYDAVFQSRCHRRETVDSTWWTETGGIIDGFLENLQRRVDAYCSGHRSSVFGHPEDSSRV
jgi:5-methylcytosine-specific restriction endonuclease McrA